MLQVKNELDQLINAIRNSDVAQKYEEIRKTVEQDAELSRQINEFRRRNFELQTQTYPDQMMEVSDSFTKEYACFRENPLVQEFLEAELAYCRMLQEVTTEIVGVVALDL